jgi:hypothetical protein
VVSNAPARIPSAKVLTLVSVVLKLKVWAFTNAV